VSPTTFGGAMYNLDFITTRYPFWMREAGLDNDMNQVPEGNYNTPVHFNPTCEIWEKEKSFVLTLDIPGFKKDQVSIEVKENYLTISGERKTVHLEGAKLVNSEKVYGKFQRTFSLPKNINTDLISAHFEHGVLEIEMPKEEKALARKIVISENPTQFPN
jgi:HSP20 family molecular chaperone IbpA